MFYDEVKEDYVFIKSENIPESYEFEGILKDDRLEKHHIHPSKLLDLQEEITNFAKYTIEKSIADTICDEEQYSLF